MNTSSDGQPAVKRRKFAEHTHEGRRQEIAAAHSLYSGAVNIGTHQWCSVTPSSIPNSYESTGSTDLSPAIPIPSPSARIHAVAEHSGEELFTHTHNASHTRDAREELDETVCYGMYEAADVQWNGPDHKVEGNLFQVVIRHGMIHTSADSGTYHTQAAGRILCERSLRILDYLSTTSGLLLECYCRTRAGPLRENRRRKFGTVSPKLLVNIYGHRRLSESVGKFFTRLRISLRDPMICEQNVPYANPHLFTDEGDDVHVVMTSSFRPTPLRELFTAPADVLNEILHTDHLPEATPPLAISTTLHKHQRQALFFMQQKEQGYTIERHTGCSRPHKSSQWVEGQISSSLNSGSLSSIPATSRVVGGIIADQMGLGKTLQMISLIASDLEQAPRHDQVGHSSAQPVQSVPRATLVIVPVSLLQTWDDQLNAHLKPGTLQWQIFHGRRRGLAVSDIPRLDIVLTTYDTILSEHRKSLSSPLYSGIANFYWKRIILDEAHCIRNANSLRARAICALSATSRWAVTGTPIQNRLTDLFSILHFLQAAPFDDFRTFNTAIVHPWKSSLDRSAISILKELVKSVAIRRTKASVNLPLRKDEVRWIELSKHERNHYETIRSQLKRDMDDADLDDGEGSLSVLRWIDTLRVMCSRGPEHSLAGQVPTTTAYNHADNEDADWADQDPAECNDKMDTTDYLEIGVDSISSDLSVSCSTASVGLLASGSARSSSFLMVESSYQYLDGHASESNSPTPSDVSTRVDAQAPLFSKTQALLTDIMSHTGKVVVFSFWRATLSSIDEALQITQVPSLTLDGSKPVSERNQIIESFRQDFGIKVLLTTISAGGVGLDLTVANLICLVEPQWNPTVEEQALSRVHRMNQKQPVTTIRYVVKGSIEENVLELQRRKTQLASLALEGDDKSASRSMLRDLKLLLS